MLNQWKGWLCGVVLGLCLGVTDGLAYEQRSNTVSVGIQGGYGFMSGTEEFTSVSGATVIPYETFEAGPGITINVKYSLDRKTAIGVTFDDLRFDRKSGRSGDFPNQFQANNVLARYYKYFSRRSRYSRNLFVGAGYHRPAFRISDQENILPGEGFSVNYGAGLEYFLTRVATIDLTFEGYYMKPKGGTSSSGQVKLGLHYYFVR